MKTLYLYTLLFFYSVLGYAQTNLIPNPSFEDTVGCPAGLADISKAAFWTAPTEGSPDFFYSCNGGSAGVPNNLFGNQNAFSGNAYVGIAVYDTWATWSYREYIQVQLNQTLSSGQEYWVTFYVNLSDSSFFAIREIGAYFSNTLINSSMDTTLSVVPQIEFTDSVVTDKNGWVKITGSFTATGNENYMIIGNFNRSQNTSALATNGNQNYSYYYIDDVCVSSDSLTCSQSVGINNSLLNEFNFDLYPNPTENFVYIKNNSKTDFRIEVYNSLGQLLTKKKKTEYDELKLDLSEFADGVLFIKVISSNSQTVYKIHKQ